MVRVHKTNAQVKIDIYSQENVLQWLDKIFETKCNNWSFQFF